MSYTITSSAGNTIGSIATASRVTTLAPITFIGEGISQYGQDVANDLYHMIEHFSNTTAPSYPVAGLIWYKSDTQVLSFYNGSDFIPIGSAINSNSQLIAKKAVSFSTTGFTDLFDNINGYTVIPTAILFVPNNVTITSPPVFNLFKGVAITSFTNTSNVVTVTTAQAHNMVVGTVINIANATPSAFNGTWTITAITGSTTFTFSISAGNPSSGTGGLFYISEDVLSSTIIDNPSLLYHQYYTIDGTTAHLQETIDSFYLDVTTAPSGTSNYTAYLFGFTIT